jgi:hypothetical protein
MKTKKTTKAKATKKAFVSPAVKAFKKAVDKAAQAPTPKAEAKVNATKVAKAYMQVMGATEATYDDGRGNVTTVKATDPKVMVAKLDAAIAAADQAVAAQAKAKPSKAAKVEAPKAEAAAPLKMRLYAKGKTGGQLYFPVAAAKTLNGHGWVTITANGKLVTITPTQGEAKKVQENQVSLPLTYSHGNPQVMATKVLALTGWNNTTQDLAITLVKGSLQVEVK